MNCRLFASSKSARSALSRSSEREENTFYRVSWIEDGLAYSIYTYNPGTLTADDFFQMAQEVIEA